MQIQFNPQSNFWDIHPELITGFKEIYKIDREESSKIMWAIALYVHPDSVYAPMSEPERLSLICKDYLEGEIEFDDTIYKKEIDLFKTLCMSKKERYLYEWGKKLDERDQFISSLKYDDDTAEFLDKLMGNTKKLQEQYDKALEEYTKEKIDSTGKGGAEESLRERLKA